MADAVRDELLRLLENSNSHVLRVEEVWEWARTHPKSALHASIEWNEKKAAREYQYWQIRRLIQIHVITDYGEPRLVSLRVDRSAGGGYREITEVLSDRKLSEYMLNDAIADLERVHQNYLRVKELSGVWKALARVRANLNQKSARAQRRSAGGGRRARQARQGEARLRTT